MDLVGVSGQPLILALNPGSSSLKASLFTPARVLTIEIDRMGTPQASLSVTRGDASSQRPFTGDLGNAVDAVRAQLIQNGLAVQAVAHRVVHGGPRHHRPTLVDDGLIADLRDAIPLAPLHLPGGIAAIAHARRAWPLARHIACFDTGFHHDLPERSRRLPVADGLVRDGVRRYGFHGLSIESVLHARPDIGQSVIAHLGSGCSVSAVADGRPRHTSMSLTPTGGMFSATRSGDLDPEITLFLMGQRGYTVEQLRLAYNNESGLAGISGGRHDLRDLQAATDDSAALALMMFADSAAMAIASCATRLDNWQSLVFTGGAGEHSASLRAEIASRLLPLRGQARHAGIEAEVALADTGLDVIVVPADEEGVLDRMARQLLGAAPST